MRPLKRYGVNKGRSSGKFRKQASKSKLPNVIAAPMRGGWRL